MTTFRLGRWTLRTRGLSSRHKSPTKDGNILSRLIGVKRRVEEINFENINR